MSYLAIDLAVLPKIFPDFMDTCKEKRHEIGGTNDHETKN